ncbi:hypothetical protein NFX46_18590 [Streptomyces phaeoluteigriseus]|uniref:Uncharacterized protein n=1 Tax=Streptomyces phaeoluteigriseus TaxID=114686 RepID=A0ABY4ZBA4_9ACTN|nr:hypothetical protein [Streptomyces phaeoluteigriseus]USQ85602.1 hypothetical protein NFX46_18590 [Streptomyces phaeoluteigriseus]
MRIEDLTAQRAATAVRHAMATTGAGRLRVADGVGRACDLTEQGANRLAMTPR